MIVRSAAFDIGSGATKLMVADVALGPPARITKILFGKELPVQFAMAWKQSADGKFDCQIQEKGLAVLRRFLEECDRLEAKERSAIATEVFRKAGNGGDYLRRVKEELGLDVSIVSQEDEGQLGFRTAVALQGRPEEEVLCWDSGGASFQITSIDPGGGPLRSYLGTLGSGVCTCILVEEIQRLGSFAENRTPNPVQLEHAYALVERFRRDLASPVSWLQGGQVTAIGGINSMFCLTSELLGMQSYTYSDVERAIPLIVGQTDEELVAKWLQGDDRDPASACCPKVCLLLAVMQHCGIERVNFQLAIGSCPGLIISSDRYSC
eukprot:TRINITY_DN33608_c0_g1_i1.p1 TRINITY_DN33608_c0_g1~~TRINITY_DN33608_c0_g1_i1.p1  ORF type:complete len:322 (-),score=74.01 TRINITY_DN33608_c0_g1_i1:40-1005(-)